METIAAGSWIDIFFLILCLYTIYIAVSRGPQREILRIIGVLVGSFFAFQHYPLVAQFIADKLIEVLK